MNGRQKVFPPVHRGSRLSGLTADGAFSVSCAPARAIMALLTCQGVAIRSKIGLRPRHVLSNAPFRTGLPEAVSGTAQPRAPHMIAPPRDRTRSEDRR